MTTTELIPEAILDLIATVKYMFRIVVLFIGR